MLPYLTSEQLKEIDERMSSEFGVSTVQLMEVAGTRMAEFLRDRSDDISQEKILVICGKGNNGGDGFVAARILNNFGAEVQITLASPRESYEGIALQNLESCEKVGIDFVSVRVAENGHSQLRDVDVILDCLFGFGFAGELREEHKALVEYMNNSTAKVFSCDLPSGMNADSFEGELTVQADYTLSFAFPKKVFENKEARKRCGEIHILDIGITRALYEELGVEESLFIDKSWIKLKEE
jgi:hydroxyethylthiazole kinase-like uncharacterized protein yjeF